MNDENTQILMKKVDKLSLGFAEFSGKINATLPNLATKPDMFREFQRQLDRHFKLCPNGVTIKTVIKVAGVLLPVSAGISAAIFMVFQ